MMGGSEQGPCIIACRLCHLSLSLDALGIHSQIESFMLEKKRLEGLSHDLYM